MSSSGLAKDDVRGQLGFVWFSFPPVGQFPLLMCLHAPAGPGYLWSRRASGATKNVSVSTFTLCLLSHTNEWLAVTCSSWRVFESHV